MNTRELAVYIAEVIEKVRKEGDKALVYYTSKFDGIDLKPQHLRVAPTLIASAAVAVEPQLKKAMQQAAANIRKFHTNELRHTKRSWSYREGKTVLGQVYRPVETVGLYIPGGRYPYPSTVLMTAIPAKVAGVRRIVMVTPAKNVTPVVLYAASLAGVDEVYQVGGPAAVAALAYGTKTLPEVDLIVGPGNAFVNEAKRQVYGKVGIDSLAGPSEVAIIADGSATADYIVEDLLAQAEHDPMARAYLYSDASDVVAAVRKKIPSALRNQIELKTLSMDKAIEAVNLLAPEHLELMVKDLKTVAAKIKNAGAIFAGHETPTAAGDYWAGPSHVLPTGKTARFSSGLSVSTFLKRSSYIQYDRRKLVADAPLIERFAGSEGLEHHRRSVEIRRTGEKR